MSETLVLIGVDNLDGVVRLSTIWATTADLRAGHRLTRIESVADHPALLWRLAELVPGFFPPAAAAQMEGSAAMAAGPDDPAPAAGDGQAEAA